MSYTVNYKYEKFVGRPDLHLIYSNMFNKQMFMTVNMNHWASGTAFALLCEQ